MKTIALIREFPETKEARIQFVQDIISYALSGEVNPLEIEIYLKCLEKTIGFVREDVRYKECINDEIDKHPEDTFDYRGAVITKCHKTTYDYSKDSRHKELEELIKERKQFLKVIPKTGFVDPVSGEITYRPPKKITDYIKIEYK